jgi:class 3 adenylate cyclase
VDDAHAADALATRHWGLRFVAADTETDYRDWRTATVVPFVRVGLIASILNWLLYLLTLSLILPASLPLIWPAIFGISMPFLVLTLTLTFVARARHLIMPLSAVTNLIAGSLLPWQLHEVIDLPGSPGIMSLVNLMLMFFGFIIFRMPPLLAIAAVFPYLGLTLFLLTGDVRAGRIDSIEYWAHVATQLIAGMNGILVALVLEVMTRRAYVSHRLVVGSQSRLEQNQKLIRRYMPPAVADHIIAGKESEIGVPQRRRVTILFADIVGFTAVADRVEPEVITEILNEYMSMMAGVIETHGGTLNEFAGDGLMALFGAPDALPPEQQALKAIAAAKDMQRKMPSLNQRWRKLGLGAELGIRIGINTGMVSVGIYGSAGRMTYTEI